MNVAKDKLDNLTAAIVENILSTPDDQIIEESREDAREEWQPIGTAPRDGTAFLAYWWREHTDGTRYEAFVPYVVAHYMGVRLFPSWILEKDPPTHWRMLPEPPSTWDGRTHAEIIDQTVPPLLARVEALEEAVREIMLLPHKFANPTVDHQDTQG